MMAQYDARVKKEFGVYHYHSDAQLKVLKCFEPTWFEEN